jgi:DNA-directed RNA polymerase
MGLDATASGLQIMSVLSGCVASGKATNLVNTGEREDVYDAVAASMCANDVLNTTKDQVKKPVMTVFYGSKAQPKAIFGEDTPELFAFYDTLREILPGPFELMDILQSYWRSDVLHHSWTLPDGHRAIVPVIDVIDKSLEIDEMDHIRVAYRTKVLRKKRSSRALAANIVHSIDGFIVRQMVKLAKKDGFWIAPIHDCFYAHPNYMNQVRENYVKILTWIAHRNILQPILSEIAGYNVRYAPRQQGLGKLLPDAEYALS